MQRQLTSWQTHMVRIQATPGGSGHTEPAMCPQHLCGGQGSSLEGPNDICSLNKLRNSILSPVPHKHLLVAGMVNSSHRRTRCGEEELGNDQPASPASGWRQMSTLGKSLCPRVRRQHRGRAVRCSVHGLPPRSPGPAITLVSCHRGFPQGSS